MTLGKGANLEPVDAASGRLIVARFALEHLDHEALAPIFDAFIQERLDVFRLFAIRRLGELKLKVNRLKMLLQELSPFRQVSVQQWLRTPDQISNGSKPKLPFAKTLTSPFR